MLLSLARPAFRRSPAASFRRLPLLLHGQRSASMSSLSDKFAAKVALGKTLPPLADNAVKLEMYALYKQANVGKVNKPRPGMLDFVGRAMWDAWNKLGDMNQDEAMTKYIAIIDELAAKHGAPGAGSDAAVESDTEDLLVDISESGLLTIQLNRPKKYNALNHGMYEGIIKALQTSASQERVKAVLLKASGAMFSSGNDLTMFTSNPQGLTLEQLADAGAVILEDFVNAFLTYPKPVVAAVQGPAVGIAVTILGLCDLVYVSETTTLHTPFTALGQSPEACSSALFPRIMGPARANALLLLGEKIGAQEAVSSGLATNCFSVGDFDKQVKNKVDLLLTRYPGSMQRSKALIRSPAYIAELKEINRAECETLKQLWIGPECMDAILKFQSRKK